MRARGLLVCLAALWAAGPATRAQQVPPAGQQRAVFRAEADRVRLNVLATHDGLPLRGLTAEDFEVRDNGVLISGLEVTSTEERVSVAVALDISGSVAEDFMDEMLDAVEGVVNALRPGDTAWLLTFAGQLDLRAGPVQNREAIRTRLEGLRTGGGGTAMWDALYASVSLASAGTARALALLFTDGLDSSSWATETQVLDAVRRSDVVVTVVRPRHAIAPRGSPVNYFLNLERAALASGGAILKTERSQSLDEQFVALLDQFRSGYVLSYAAGTIPARDDGWHEVSVKLRGRKGRVQTRPGYFEPGR
ncbi:MAG: VWA domain-containing protein [Vicinamibacterales bacterium]